MRRHLRGQAAFLLIVATPARADFVPSPPTGFQKEVHVAAPTRIDWQFVAGTFKSGSGADRDADDGYVSKKQRYQLYVPKNYNAAKAWPLVVFVSSEAKAKLWSHWQKPCEELGMLYCEAENAGNGCPTIRRTRIVLDMLDDVRRHYRIDSHQTYLSGESGGGRMACHIGFALPEYFAGVAPICGTEALRELTYLRHRMRDRQSVVFITGTEDFNLPENKRYMAPLFQDLNIRSKLWMVEGMGHDMPRPEILTEVLRWLAQDLPRRLSDAKARPGLAIAPDEAPAAELQAARQLEAARAEAKQPERLWQAAASAQGILDRWGQSPSAKAARKLLKDLHSDPRQAALLEKQRRADEWRTESARARARERMGMMTPALQSWKELARKYAQTSEGNKAVAEAERMKAVIAALPNQPFLGIKFVGYSLKVREVVEDGPAHRTDMQAGDVVTKFNGRVVRQREDLRENLRKHKPGDKVRLEVQRDGQSVTVTIALGSHRVEEQICPKGW